MTKRKQFILGVSVALTIAVIAASPFAWHAGTLYWAKSKARRVFAGMTPEQRGNLNATPTLITLPAFNPDAQPVETTDFNGYLVRTLQPTARETDREQIHLTYPRFQVRIIAPMSLTANDSLARQFHFKNAFDQLSASYDTRLDDLESQRDLSSLRRFLILIDAKPDRTRYIEKFERGDLQGFIEAPIPGTKRTVVGVFVPRIHAACGVWFMDAGGLTLNDVHEFLAALHFDMK